MAAIWSRQASGVTVSLRGVDVVSAQVAWASGERGTVLRTLDGGSHWSVMHVPGAEDADLRSLRAFDAERAIVVSAGAPALIFATADGGASWQLRHEDRRAEIFLDGIAFADDARGWVIGDPIDGHFVLLATDDGGASWRELDRAPAAEPGEAAFAASGSSVAARGGRVYVATGGSVARVSRSADDGESWAWANTPVASGRASSGVFSIAFADDRHGVIVGGDYLAPEQSAASAAFTLDGGRTWHPAERMPSGYRSCVCVASSFGPGVRFAVGTNGADLSRDGGRTWSSIHGEGFHAIGFAPDAMVGFAVGAGGRVSRISTR